MPAYEEGRGFALVVPHGFALLSPEISAEGRAAVWTSMREGSPTRAALGRIVQAYGGQLDDLPAFALVAADASTGRVRVVVCGEVTVHVRTAAGESLVEADDHAPWADGSFADVTHVVARLADGSDDPLWVGEGIVRAMSVSWDTVESSRTVAPSTAPASSPAPPAAAAPPVKAIDPMPVAAPPVESLPDEPASLPAAVPADIRGSLPAEGETIAALVDATIAADPAEEHTTGYDDLLFGETRMSTVEDAAVRAAEPESVMIGAIPTVGPAMTPAAPAPVLGDHDGRTVSSAQLAALRGRVAAASPMPVPVSHAAPVLVLASGERHVLDRGAVIGVRPSATRVTGVLPHLIAVESPEGEISRRHLELRAEGGYVLAVDLDSTNGTRLLRPGAEPVRLHPNAPTLLVAGDRIDLGEGIVLSFEGLR